MNLDILPLGENAPHDINVVIEIPSQGSPVKYQLDKDSGTQTLTLDRFMDAAIFYPCNYGFMPHTLSDNGILEQITYFFGQYKELDSAKWVKLESWLGIDEAEPEIPGNSQRLNRL